ncbi:hypothetical protein CBS101457_006066 [Exobasidium rhododendri]|nr:hypothetical protein CBS101457_006066 [Exobasidium rhododendri]
MKANAALSSSPSSSSSSSSFLAPAEVAGDALDLTTMEYTGPGVWTDAVYAYLNEPNYFTSQEISASSPIPIGQNVTSIDFIGLTDRRVVGDVAVLPITSFSPGIGHMGAKPTSDPLAFVHHRFQGSWKAEEDGNEEKE